MRKYCDEISTVPHFRLMLKAHPKTEIKEKVVPMDSDLVLNNRDTNLVGFLGSFMIAL